jgi:hypothetical protein
MIKEQTQDSIPNKDNPLDQIKSLGQLFKFRSELQLLSVGGQNSILKKLTIEALEKLSIKLNLDQIQVTYADGANIGTLSGVIVIGGKIIKVSIHIISPHSLEASYLKYTEDYLNKGQKSRPCFRFNPVKSNWDIDIIEELDRARFSFHNSKVD